MTLKEECQAIQERHPGWHVYTSDCGKPWAACCRTTPGFGGSGTTLTAPGVAVIEQVIAAFDYALDHGRDPWHKDAGVTTPLAGKYGAAA